jgi:hypothetical protein
MPQQLTTERSSAMLRSLTIAGAVHEETAVKQRPDADGAA